MDDGFSIRYLQRSGKNYISGPEADCGLLIEGPPRLLTWIVLSPFDYMYELSHRGHLHVQTGSKLNFFVIYENYLPFVNFMNKYCLKYIC